MNVEAGQFESEELLWRSSDRQGVRIVTLLPLALEATHWAKTAKRLRQFVEEQPQGLVIDCRQLPPNAVDVTGPLFYELLIFGRRQRPKVEICVVGRADQTTGDSKTLALPTRVDTVDDAATLLRGNEQSGPALPRRLSGVSEQAIGGEPLTQFSVSGRAAQTGVMLVVTVLSWSAVVYSYSQTFTKPQKPRRLVSFEPKDSATTNVASNPGARSAVFGTIAFLADNEPQSDVGANILMWPVNSSAQNLRIDSRSAFDQLPSKNDDFRSSQADRGGEYRLPHRQLSDLERRSYYLLVVSAHRERGAAPEDKDIESLKRYFENPEALLGTRAYRLKQISLDAFDTAEENVLFAGDESRTQPGSDAGVSTAN